MKRIVLILLILSMVFSGTVFCFAEQGQPEKNVINYVSLGESNVVGLGLSAYYSGNFHYHGDGFYHKIPGSYPALVEEMLEEKYNVEVELKPLAICGSRIYDIRAILDTDIPLDKFFSVINWCMADTLKAFDEYQEVDVDSLSAEEIRSALHPVLEEGIRNADIITLDSAENDLSAVATNVLTGDYAEMDKIAYMIGKKEYAEIRKSIITRLEEAIPDFSENEILHLASGLIDAVTWGYIDTTLNFDQLVKMIYEMNPDVELVVVDSVPCYDKDVVFDVPGVSDRFPVGKILEVMFGMVREYRRSLSPYASRYKFAELHDPESFLSEMCKEEYAFADLTPDALNGAKRATKKVIPEDEWGVLDDPVQFEQIIGRVRKLLQVRLHHMSEPAPELLVDFSDFLTGKKSEAECSAEEMTAFSEMMFDLYALKGFAGGHPNANGHKARANAVMKAIGSYLNARQDRFVDFTEESIDAIENCLSEKQNKMAEAGKKMIAARIEIKNTIRENVCESLAKICSITKNIVQKLVFPAFR